MSRKLDALVAEKVMGWPVEWLANDDGSRDNDAFRYSTDPAARLIRILPEEEGKP